MKSLVGESQLTKRLHEIEEILSNLHHQSFDLLLRRHVERRQRRQIFNRQRLRVRRQLQRPTGAGLWPWPRQR